MCMHIKSQGDHLTEMAYQLIVQAQVKFKMKSVDIVLRNVQE